MSPRKEEVIVCLGVWPTNKAGCKQDIIQGTGITKLTISKLQLKIRKDQITTVLTKLVVFPAITHGLKTWILAKELCRKFFLKCYATEACLESNNSILIEFCVETHSRPVF